MSKEGQIWFNPNAVANITREKHDNGIHAGWKPIKDKPDYGNANFDDAIQDVLNKGGKVYNFNLSENEFNLDEKIGKICRFIFVL